MIINIPIHQPCPTCGRCPTCGQYKPVQLGPIHQTGAGSQGSQRPVPQTFSGVPIGGYYAPYPSTDRSL